MPRRPSGCKRYDYADEFSSAVCGLILVTEEGAEDTSFDDVNEEEASSFEHLEEALADCECECEHPHSDTLVRSRR